MQDFRHIRAWQRAHAMAIALDKILRRFPRAYAHLRSQLARAADSIGSTIVEGCGANTNADFARFLDMSIKSANETEDRLLKAYKLGLISRQDWHKYTAETIEIRKMTWGYRATVLENAKRSKKKKA